jgi:hypothetical protein
MNNTLLSTALLSILCSTAYADNTAQPATVPVDAKTQSAPPVPLPAAAPASSAATTTPQSPQTIDCQYRIPATTTTIDQSVLSTWAKKAAVQSFEFNPTTIDQELDELKTCYTDQGWQGFNDALQKSGNINAIKTQKLTVSSQVDGELTIVPSKDNQWKITVPMQVVYQNEKEKLTQLLSVDLLIGRKVSGDLGIMQMIATPRPTAAQQPAAEPVTTTTTAPANAPVAAETHPAEPAAAPQPAAPTTPQK